MTAGPVDEVRVRPAGDGATLLRVRAQPGARRAGACGVWPGSEGGELRLAVREAAHGGRANEAVVALAAELFGLRPSAVELVRGHSARSKLLRLELDAASVRRRLAELVG